MSNRYGPANLYGSEAKEHWRKIRTEDLATVAEKLGITMDKKTPYQYRLVGYMDFYPTNGAWHDTITGRRGDFHTIHDIYRLLEQRGHGAGQNS